MLTEMVVDNYIPNDTHMSEEESRLQVCTQTFTKLNTTDSHAPAYVCTHVGWQVRTHANIKVFR